MSTRPTKDQYFLSLAKVCSTRSMDPRTKHGCVVVDCHGKILSTGYNSPPAGLEDHKVPTTAPEKYVWFEHAERNAIYAAAQHGTPLNGALFYVTGEPCSDCLRAILQVGARGVVFGDVQSKCVCESSNQAILRALKPEREFIFEDITKTTHHSLFDCAFDPTVRSEYKRGEPAQYPLRV